MARRRFTNASAFGPAKVEISELMCMSLSGVVEMTFDQYRNKQFTLNRRFRFRYVGGVDHLLLERANPNDSSLYAVSSGKKKAQIDLYIRLPRATILYMRRVAWVIATCLANKLMLGAYHSGEGNGIVASVKGPYGKIDPNVCRMYMLLDKESDPRRMISSVRVDKACHQIAKEFLGESRTLLRR